PEFWSSSSCSLEMWQQSCRTFDVGKAEAHGTSRLYRHCVHYLPSIAARRPSGYLTIAREKHAMSEIVTAAMVVIGDEILSGRTKDRNVGHLADMMTAVGIDLKEVRIVPDEEPAIVEAINALRTRNT